MGLFIEQAFTNPDLYFMWVVLVIFSICCHEYSHAQVALWEGDSTAADEGHLTLNPMIQMGPFSLGMCAIIGIAWGAVPVNPSRMRHRYSDALVAFAGPLMNVILFICFAFVAAACARMGFPYRTYVLFKLGSVLNIVLFIFNMLPVPPLDGATVFSFLSPKLTRINEEFKNGVTVFLFLLVLVSFHVLFTIGERITHGLIFLIFKCALLGGRFPF